MNLPADFTAAVILLISLSGLLAGVFLSHLAPEELAAGKKYFILLYRALFMVLSFLISYLLYPFFSFWLFFSGVFLCFCKRVQFF